MFSLAYIDEYWSPLSVGQAWGELVWILFILFRILYANCSNAITYCAPSNFRTGTPNYLRTIVDMADFVSPVPLVWSEQKDAVEAKIVINCVHCNSPLKVPTGYTGNVKCPSCGEKFEVK